MFFFGGYRYYATWFSCFRSGIWDVTYLLQMCERQVWRIEKNLKICTNKLAWKWAFFGHLWRIAFFLNICTIKKAQKYGAKNVTFSYTPPHRKTTFRTGNRRSFFDGRERFCLQKGGEWAIKEALFYAFGEGIVILWKSQRIPMKKTEKNRIFAKKGVAFLFYLE